MADDKVVSDVLIEMEKLAQTSKAYKLRAYELLENMLRSINKHFNRIAILDKVRHHSEFFSVAYLMSSNLQRETSLPSPRYVNISMLLSLLCVIYRTVPKS